MKILYYLTAIALIISCNKKPENSEVKNRTLTKSDSILRQLLIDGIQGYKKDSTVYVKMEKLYDSLSAHEKRELIDLIQYRGDFETEIEGSHELDRPAEDQSRY